MSADITEERIAATEEEIESGIAFARRAIELHESRSAPWGKVILTLHDQLLSARSQLAALQSVPQGVEVPELTAEQEIAIITQFALKEEWPSDGVSEDFMDYVRWGLTIGMRYAIARLVPTPPQAAQPEERRVGPDEVVVGRDLLRQARDNCQATLAESDISDHVKIYRQGLFERLSNAIRTSAQDHNGEGAK